MKVKEESEKAGLKLNIQKMNIMASSPITSWQIDGETMETVADFIFLNSKITADGDCSLEIKRCLLLGRKAMAKVDCVLKSKHITLPTSSKEQVYFDFMIAFTICSDFGAQENKVWHWFHCFPIYFAMKW